MLHSGLGWAGLGSLAHFFNFPPIFSLSNICNLVSIRLDSNNFLLWNFQMTVIFKGHKLFGFIVGSCPKPNWSTTQPHSKFERLDCKRSPKFESLKIIATLSPSSLPYVLGCTSSIDMWDVLGKHISYSFLN